MPLYRPQNRLQVFISSRILEFKKVREALHKAINENAALEPYSVYVYEWSVPEGEHEEAEYTSALRDSAFAVFILGDDLGEGTQIEFKEWQRISSKSRRGWVFLKDIARKDEFERILGSPLKHVPVPWTTDEELVENILQTLKNATAVTYRTLERVLTIEKPTALQFAPDAPIAYRRITSQVSGHLNKGEVDQAWTALEELAKGGSSESDIVEIENIRAFILRRNQRFPEAMELYSDLYLRTSEERFELGRILALYESGDRAGAESQLNSLDTPKLHPLYKLLTAYFAHDRGLFEQAIKTLKSQDLADRYGYDYYVLLGSCYAKLGQHRRAAACYRKAMKLDETLAPVAQAHLSASLLHIADSSLDERHVLAGLEEINASMSAVLPTIVPEEKTEDFIRYQATTKSALLQYQGRTEEALETLERNTGTDPNNVYLYNLANLKYALGRGPITIDLLEQAAVETVDHTLWLNLLGAKLVRVLNGEADFDWLEGLANDFKDHFPTSPGNNLADGVKCMSEGDFEKALSLWRTVYRDNRASFVARITAINFSLVTAHKAGLPNRFDELSNEAISLGLASIELIGNGLESLRMRLAKVEDKRALFEQALRLLASAEQALRHDRRSITNAEKMFFRIGANLYRIAHAAGQFSSSASKVDGLRALLAADQLTEFDAGMGAEMQK